METSHDLAHRQAPFWQWLALIVIVATAIAGPIVLSPPPAPHSSTASRAPRPQSTQAVDEAYDVLPRSMSISATPALASSAEVGAISAMPDEPLSWNAAWGQPAQQVGVPTAEFTPPLTPIEARIFGALDSRTDIAFDDTPLSTAMHYLADSHGITIYLDAKGLADSAVDASAPVTRQLKNVKLRSALHLILDEFDLTFVCRDDVLNITSKDKADEIRVTRVYPVSDLVWIDKEGKYPQWGPLIQLITSTIKPDSWDDNGGTGSIQPVMLPAKALAVSQTHEVHDEILELFRAMRAVGRIDGKPAPYSSLFRPGSPSPSLWGGEVVDP